MMGSVSAALNSIATVFSYDVVKRWRPETSDRGLVLCGRIATAAAMVLSIAWSPLVGHFKTIFQGLNDIICYMAPPVTAVFLLGVFWRKTSSKAAMITMLSQFVVGVVIFVVAWQEWFGWKVHSMLSGFAMFWLSIATLIVFSYLYPDQQTAERIAPVWKSPWDPLRGKSWRLLGNYRVLAGLLFVTMVALYWQFAGSTSYYPVQATITLDGRPVVGADVTFESENPRYRFTQITGADGIIRDGTDSLAGGASGRPVPRESGVRARHGDTCQIRRFRLVEPAVRLRNEAKRREPEPAVSEPAVDNVVAAGAATPGQ